MKLLFSQQIRSMCFRLGQEATKVFASPIYFYGGKPSVRFWVPPRTNSAVFARKVLLILRRSAKTKVGYAVVVFNPVYVIQPFIRPFTMNIQPRKSMSDIAASVNLAGDVSACDLPLHTASNEPSKLWSLTYPSQVSGIWVVVKKFAQACCGKIGLSHDAPYKRIGQRPRCVTSTSRLRHFSGILPKAQGHAIDSLKLQKSWPTKDQQ